ncbi:MAG: malectin domain-containing carbohydrate-binding protein [Pseudomonadota bacterium]
MANVGFSLAGVIDGINGGPSVLSNPTSLQFGPDGRLYVSEQNGTINAFTVSIEDGQFIATDHEVLTIGNTSAGVVQSIQNHNDDGSEAGQSNRQVTGIVVAGTEDEPVLYVTSSDPRIASNGEVNLDTNSGVLTKVSFDSTTQEWTTVDLIRGLPRSEENHATNGMVLSPDGSTLYMMVGGNTNNGAPSSFFSFTAEYALSGTLLEIDLDAIDLLPTQSDLNGGQNGQARDYKYDLPTLDDPNTINAPSEITDAFKAAVAGLQVGDTLTGQVLVDLGIARTIDDATNAQAAPITVTADLLSSLEALALLDNGPLPDSDAQAAGFRENADGLDIAGPWGGNDGLNQAVLPSDAPLSIFADGFRNAFDVAQDSQGRLFTVDNGSNGNLGGNPVTENGDEDGDGISGEATNAPNNGGTGDPEPLIFIQEGQYYGHPAPVRSNQNQEWTVFNDSGNPDTNVVVNNVPDISALVPNGVAIEDGFVIDPTKFATGEDQTLADLSEQDAEDRLLLSGVRQERAGGDGPLSDSITTVGSSTNGIIVYDTNGEVFDGAADGAIIVTQFNDNVTLLNINEDATDLTALINSGPDDILGTADDVVQDSDGELFLANNSLGVPLGNPLDVTQGPNGTLWVAEIGSNEITVLAPSGVILPGDNDSDDDGILNADDPFLRDATNGTSVVLVPGEELEFEFSQDAGNVTPGPDGFGGGLTGHLIDGQRDFEQFLQSESPREGQSIQLDNVKFVTAADGGTTTIEAVSNGNPEGVGNPFFGENGSNGEFLFHTGVLIPENIDEFTIEWTVANSATFDVSALTGASQELGGYIGDGTQSNFLKITAQRTDDDDASAAIIDILLEDGDQQLQRVQLDATGIFDPANLPDESDILFELIVDPQGATAIPRVTYESTSGPVVIEGSLNPGEFIDLSNSQVLETILGNNTVQGQQTGLAIGLFASNEGEPIEDAFQAVFKRIDINATEAQVAPNAEDDTATTAVNSVLTITAADLLENDTDANLNSSLSVTGVGNATNGSVELDDAGTPGDATDDFIVFTPETDFNGTASFEYTITDDDGLTDTATVDVLVADRVVIYRVNGGGGEIAAIDGGPAWTADTLANPSQFILTSPHNANGFPAVEPGSSVDTAVVPGAIWDTERWDPATGPELLWGFDVEPGRYEVNLYVGNGFGGTSAPGTRVFDVAIEGDIQQSDDPNSNFDSVDLSGTFGHQVGAVITREIDVVDGQLNIEFLHEIENPLVNGIEIVQLATFAPGTPTISILGGDQTVSESDGTIQVSIASSTIVPEDENVEVVVSIASGTAFIDENIASGNGDFVVDETVNGNLLVGEFNANLTINGGSADIQIPIDIVNDMIEEDAESFTVTITSVSNNAVIGVEDSITITIEDDDQSPTVSIETATALESGDVGDTALTFPITIDPAADGDVTIEYEVMIGDGEPQFLSTTLPGTGGEIAVNVPNDDEQNGPDSVAVQLLAVTAGDAVISTTAGSVTGTVTEDDAPAGTVVLAINAGGPALTQDGIDFLGNQNTVPGAAGNPGPLVTTLFGGDAGFLVGNQFADGASGNGQQDDFNGTVFDTERFGGSLTATDDLTFFAELPEDEYTVTLYFAEIFQPNTAGGDMSDGIGARVFDVFVEEQLVLDDFDILAQTNGDFNQPIVFDVPGTFTVGDNGQLDITASASIDNAKLSAIVIRLAEDDPGDVTAPQASVGIIVPTTDTGDVVVDITFNEAVTAAAFAEEDFVLNLPDGGELTSSDVMLAGNGLSAQVIFTAPVEGFANGDYGFTLGEGAFADLAGNNAVVTANPGAALSLALDANEVYDENVLGDISSDNTAPTEVSLNAGAGSSIIDLSATDSNANDVDSPDGAGDRDYFTITVEEGFEITEINLLNYSAEDGANLAFLALSDEDTVNFLPDGSGEEPVDSNLIGGNVIGSNNVGNNIIGLLGGGGIGANIAGSGFEGPLGPGTYTFWYQQNLQTSRASIEFVKAEVAPPEPPTVETGAILLAVNAGGPALVETINDEEISFGGNTGGDGGTDVDQSGIIGDFLNGGAFGSGSASIFQTERFGGQNGPFNFEATGLTPGELVSVELLLAEGFFDTANSRVFDVELEGVLVIDDLDLAGTAGTNVPVIQRFGPIEVPADGVINIDFSSSVNNASVRGIIIREETDERAVIEIGAPAPVEEAGDTGETILSFPITFDEAPLVPVSVEVEINNNGVISTQIVDLGTAGGSVDVSVANDDVFDGDETVNVTILSISEGDAFARIGFGADGASSAVTEDELSPVDLDDDGILNTADPFFIDASNGLDNALEIGGEFTLDFNTDGEDPFAPEVGFTGVQVNPAADPGGTFDDPLGVLTTEDGVTISGGNFSVASSPQDNFQFGDQNTNNIRDAYQAGIDVSGIRSFEVVAQASSADYASVIAGGGFEQFGIQIGAGGVDDFIKISVSDNGGNNTTPARVQVSQNGSIDFPAMTNQTERNFNLPNDFDLATVATYEFRLVVDRDAGANGEVTGQVIFLDSEGATLQTINTGPFELLADSSFLAALENNNPLTGGEGTGGFAYGLFVTQSGVGGSQQFTADYDFLTIRALDTATVALGDATSAVESDDVAENGTAIDVAVTTSPALADQTIDVEIGIVDTPFSQIVSVVLDSNGEGVATLDVTGFNDDLANGDDTFTLTLTGVEGEFLAVDGTANTAEATISEDDFAPVATGDSGLATPENTPISIDVLANDTDADLGDGELSIDSVGVVDPVEAGTAEIVDGEILFTPAADFVGSVTFTYVSADSAGNLSDPATVSLDVLDAAAVAVSISDAASVIEGGDDGVDTLTFPLTTIPDTFDGTLTIEFTVNGDTANPLTADIVFAAGAGSLNVEIDQDNLDNGDDAFVVELIGATSTDVLIAPTVSGSASGTITEDDIAPVFANAPSEVDVLENTTEVADFDATDDNSDPISYSLSGDDAGLFTIDETTGEVSFVEAPDFEVLDNLGDTDFDITVTAAAADGSVSQDVIVSVQDTNEVSDDPDGNVMIDPPADGEEPTPIDFEDEDPTDGVDNTPTTVTGSIEALDGTPIFNLGEEDEVVVTDVPDNVEFLSITQGSTLANFGIRGTNGEPDQIVFVLSLQGPAFDDGTQFDEQDFDIVFSDNGDGTNNVSLSLADVGNPVRIQAEDLSLDSGFFVENQAQVEEGALIRLGFNGATGQASLDLTANGVAAGENRIEIDLFDENDGESTLSVSIQRGDQVIDLGTVTLDALGGGNNAQPQSRRTVAFDNVQIVEGDVLILSGESDQQEPLRIDALEFIPVVPDTSDNQPPVFVGSIGDVELTQDDTFELNINESFPGFTDPDEDVLTIITDNPLFTVVGGVLTATPTNEDALAFADLETGGAFVVTVTATDPAGASVQTSFTVTNIVNVNDAPVITPPDEAFSFETGVTIDAFNLNDLVSDPDGDAVDVSVDVPNLPAGLEFDPETGELSGTPEVPGSFQVTITADDLNGGVTTSSLVFNVTGVGDVGDPVRIQAEDLSLDSGFFVENQTQAEEGALIRLGFNGATGQASLDLEANGIALGENRIEIDVFDENDGESTVTVSIQRGEQIIDLGTVTLDSTIGGNNAQPESSRTLIFDGVNIESGDILLLSGTSDQLEPVRIDALEFIPTGGQIGNFAPIVIPSFEPDDSTVEIPAGQTLDLNQVFADPEEDALTFGVSDPNGEDIPFLSIVNDQLTVAPDAPQEPVDIVLTAVDLEGSNITVSRSLTVVVEAPVQVPPTLVAEILDASAPEDAEFILDVSGNFAATVDELSAPGGDDITLTATLEDGTPLPAWLSFDPDTATFTGTPLQADIGEISVTVTATDDDGSVSDTFLITVENTNDAPVAIDPSPIAEQAATIGEDFALDLPDFDAFFTDEDLDLVDTMEVVSISVDPATLPDGIIAEEVEGVIQLSGTPTTTGTFSVGIVATDAAGEMATSTFDIVVSDVPQGVTGAAATLAINTGATGINSSTFSANSIFITNTSTNDVSIDQITINLSSALIADTVFDPQNDPVTGELLDPAGDSTNSNFTVDGSTSGILAGDVTVNFNGGRNPGFDEIQLDFTEGSFGTGDVLALSGDIDPLSAFSPGGAGAVSGQELAGATFTVTFSDGTTATGQLLPDGAGTFGANAEAIVGQDLMAPALALGDDTTDARVVNQANLPINIDAGIENANGTVRLFVLDTAFDTPGGSGTPANGEALPAFGSNDSQGSATVLMDLTLDENGQLSTTVPLSRIDLGTLDNAQLGVNLIAAALVNENGVGPLSTPLRVEFDPDADVPPIGDPGDVPVPVLRINAFGPTVIATDGGPDWIGDGNGAPNSPFLVVGSGPQDDRGDTQGFSGDQASVPANVPVAVLNTARSSNSPFSYEIPVGQLNGDGNYVVRLYFAELFAGNQSEGNRAFDIGVEGVTAGELDNFDPSSGVSAGSVRVLEFETTVTDGVLNLDFVQDAIGGMDNPIINAIEILSGGDGGGITPPADPADALAVLGVDDGIFDGVVQGETVDSVNNGGNNGSVVLTILDGNNTVDASNFGDNSFQLTNTGDKEVAAVFIDIRNAVFGDQVFDINGTGGDTASDTFDVTSDGGTGAFFVGEGNSVANAANLFFPGDTPAADTSGQSSGGISGGFRGLLLRFDGSDGGFDGGETVGFAGDGDPNSIAGFSSGLLNPNNVTSSGFDTGGQSGSELVGSSFTVLFADGTTATGFLGSDTTQAGAVGEAVQGRVDRAATLSIDTGAGNSGVVTSGNVGTYGGDAPVITVNGNPGDLVRVTLHKGFQPTDLQTGSPDSVQDVIQGRLDASQPEFAVNNAFDVQTVDVTIGANGTVTLPLSGANAFDFVNTNSGETFPGDDVQPLALTVSVIEQVSDTSVIAGGGASDFVPAGPVSAPIYLTNPSQTPVDGEPPVVPVDGFFQGVGTGDDFRFKVQIEDPGGEGVAEILNGTNNAFVFVESGASNDNNGGEQGAGYFVHTGDNAAAVADVEATGITTNTSIQNDPNIRNGDNQLVYRIFIPEDQLGEEFSFRFRVTRDAENFTGPDAFEFDQQNDIRFNILSEDGTVNLADLIANARPDETAAEIEAEADFFGTTGFARVAGGPDDGNFGFVSGIVELPGTDTVVFNEAGVYEFVVAGRSLGYHIDSFELFRTEGGAPGVNASDSPFIVTGDTVPTVQPIPDTTVEQGDTFSVAGLFSDLDGDDLLFTTSALPQGVSFDDGVFTIAADAALVANTPITVTAMDDDNNQVSDTFLLTVVEELPTSPVSFTASAGAQDDQELNSGLTSPDLESDAGIVVRLTIPNGIVDLTSVDSAILSAENEDAGGATPSVLIEVKDTTSATLGLLAELGNTLGTTVNGTLGGPTATGTRFQIADVADAINALIASQGPLQGGDAVTLILNPTGTRRDIDQGTFELVINGESGGGISPPPPPPPPGDLDINVAAITGDGTSANNIVATGDVIDGSLVNGDELDLNAFEDSIVFDITTTNGPADPGSFQIQLSQNGTVVNTVTESAAPFTFIISDDLLSAGDYTLTLTQFSENGLGGTNQGSTSIDFSVVDDGVISPPPPPPPPPPGEEFPVEIDVYRSFDNLSEIQSSGDLIFDDLQNGDSVNIALQSAGDLVFDVISEAPSGDPTSFEIAFTQNGNTITFVENNAPFTLEVFDNVIATGAASLSVTAFSGSGASGTNLGSTTVNFNIINDAGAGFAAASFATTSLEPPSVLVDDPGLFLTEPSFSSDGDEEENQDAFEFTSGAPENQPQSLVAEFETGFGVGENPSPQERLEAFDFDAFDFGEGTGPDEDNNIFEFNPLDFA